MVDILNYPKSPRHKTRALRNLGGEEEAAIYDLIFNDVPLRKVAHKVGLSYQGVYIRALAYMKYWQQLGELAMRPKHIAYLTDLYGDKEGYNRSTEGEADETEVKTK